MWNKNKNAGSRHKTSQKEYRAQEKDIVLGKRKGSVIAYLLGNLNERFLQKKNWRKREKCVSHMCMNHWEISQKKMKYILFG